MHVPPSHLATVLSFLLACGSSGGETSGDPVDPGSPDATVAPEADAAAGLSDALVGQVDAGDPGSLADEIEPLIVGDYVLRLRVAALQEVPFVGVIDTVSTSVGVAAIERSGNTFLLSEQGCHVDSDSGDTVVTEIPDVIPRSTPAAVEQLELWKEGENLRWSRVDVATLVGVELEHPATDSLPTEASDPRVVDQDEDGHPGVTVHVSGMASGAIYVVQRQQVAYDGGVRNDDGSFVALASDHSDQSVIGSDNPLLDQNVPTEPNPDPSLSTITLVKVGEPYDCDRAVDEAASLFP